MRIRSTKPEFWRSATIAAIAWDVRLVLKGLESYVDDNGVGKDDIALIAADIFPRDLSASPRDTLARLSEAISTLSDAGLVVRYVIDSENLLYIDRWNLVQRIDRPAKGRFPRPDGTLEYTDDVNRDSYTKPREDVTSPLVLLATGTGEQGNRGTEEQNKDSPSPDGEEPSAPKPRKPAPTKSQIDSWFAEWYDQYPLKKERQAARAKYEVMVKRVGRQILLDGLSRFLAHLDATPPEKRYIKHPATWLNKGCWEDEYTTDDGCQSGVVDEYKLWN